MDPKINITNLAGHFFGLVLILLLQLTWPKGIKPETVGRPYLSWYVNVLHCGWTVICGKKL